mgnify:CR=1 FL=1
MAGHQRHAVLEAAHAAGIQLFAIPDEGMYLMIDIVFNHTSHHHAWAEKAKAGAAPATVSGEPLSNKVTETTIGFGTAGQQH